MGFLGFGKRGREPERDRSERNWGGVRKTLDWGGRRYGNNERFARDRDIGDYYGPQRFGAGPERSSSNRYERPEEFGQNRGDWRNDWRASQRGQGERDFGRQSAQWRPGSAERDFGGRSSGRWPESGERSFGGRSANDRGQESYGQRAGMSRGGQSGYRGTTNESYGEFYREPTHGAYWSPERSSFGDFNRGGFGESSRGGEMSGYGAGRGGEMSSYGAGRGGEMSSHGAGQFRGRGPKGYRRSDERIREDVCECLTQDDRIDATNVEVQVKDCEVTLTGTVNSREEKRRAEDLIDDLPGVRDVNNNLRVVNEGGLIEGSQSRSTTPSMGQSGSTGSSAGQSGATSSTFGQSGSTSSTLGQSGSTGSTGQSGSAGSTRGQSGSTEQGSRH